jgi:hypothetical protein
LFINKTIFEANFNKTIMKNITQYLFIGLAIVFANSSCTVQKRLHNPGYHVQLNKSIKVEKSADKVLKTDEELAFAEIKTSETNLPTIKEQEKIISTITSPTEIAANYNSDIASNDESISFQKTNSSKRSLIQANQTAENQPVNVKKQELKKQELNKKAENKRAAGEAGGVALLVLIILCFFPLINLIPVFITDDGITLNFWVTLILNITFIGAVIFSLLVVLGIVSLA